MVLGIVAPLALLGSPPALGAQTTAVQLEPSSAAPGDSVTVRAGGFRSGAVVEVSGPTGALARTTADSDGSVVIAVGIPLETPPGDWPLTLRGAGSTGEDLELTATVVIATTADAAGDPAARVASTPPESPDDGSEAAAPSDLARTGSVAQGLGLTGTLLVAAGAGMVLLAARMGVIVGLAHSPETWSIRADDILPRRRRRWTPSG